MTLKELAKKMRSGKKLTDAEYEEARKLVREKMAEVTAKFKAGIAQNSNNEGE